MDRKGSTIALVAMALAAMAASGSAVGEDIFVDENATGTEPIGETWCTAYTDLQAALAVAGPGAVIRVANGTYTPTAPDGDRLISFQLASGLELLGGFAGCGAPDPDLRDPVAFETILSGDLNGDDDTGGDNSENSLHVVTGDGIDETAVLDGFTITAGHANGGNPSDRGGGIFIFFRQSSLTISNCVIRGNHAPGNGDPGLGKGGGMYGSANTGTLTGCVFADNSAANGCDSDVDGGTTTLMSEAINLSGLVAPRVSYARWYSNTEGASPEADIFEVEISGNNGASWVDLETVGPTGAEVNGGWFVKEFRVSDFVTPGSQTRVRFHASDLGAGSIVEAAVDAFVVWDVVCEPCVDPCDDGDPCTINDGCTGPNSCAGTPVDCSGMGDQCNVAGCNPGGIEGNCDTLTPVANGTTCDDIDPCNVGETCQSGICAGGGPPNTAGHVQSVSRTASSKSLASS